MRRILGIWIVFLLVFAACGDEDGSAATSPSTTTTSATTTTTVAVTKTVPTTSTAPATTTTTARTTTTTVVEGENLPTYSEVVATFLAGTELCTTQAGISGGGAGYSLGGFDGQGATLQIRDGETLAWCLGAKYVVTGPMVDEGGESIPVGALLTLDTDLRFVQVSSFD
jgi:hypothetical protein